MNNLEEIRKFMTEDRLREFLKKEITNEEAFLFYKNIIDTSADSTDSSNFYGINTALTNIYKYYNESDTYRPESKRVRTYIVTIPYGIPDDTSYASVRNVLDDAINISNLAFLLLRLNGEYSLLECYLFNDSNRCDYRNLAIFKEISESGYSTIGSSNESRTDGDVWSDICSIIETELIENDEFLYPKIKEIYETIIGTMYYTKF